MNITIEFDKAENRSFLVYNNKRVSSISGDRRDDKMVISRWSDRIERLIAREKKATSPLIECLNAKKEDKKYYTVGYDVDGLYDISPRIMAISEDNAIAQIKSLHKARNNSIACKTHTFDNYKIHDVERIN